MLKVNLCRSQQAVEGTLLWTNMAPTKVLLTMERIVKVIPDNTQRNAVKDIVLNQLSLKFSANAKEID